MTNSKVKDDSLRLILKQLYTKVIGKMGSSMEKAPTKIKTTNIRGNLVKTKDMVKASVIIRMVIFTMDFGTKI